MILPSCQVCLLTEVHWRVRTSFCTPRVPETSPPTTMSGHPTQTPGHLTFVLDLKSGSSGPLLVSTCTGSVGVCTSERVMGSGVIESEHGNGHSLLQSASTLRSDHPIDRVEQALSLQIYFRMAIHISEVKWRRLVD